MAVPELNFQELRVLANLQPADLKSLFNDLMYRPALELVEMKPVITYEDKQDIIPAEEVLEPIVCSEYLEPSKFRFRIAIERPCQDCDPQTGCNDPYSETYIAKKRRFILATKDEAELMKQSTWPIGTRLRILNIMGTDLSYTTNPNTMESFKAGDIIETFEWRGRPNRFDVDGNELGRPFVTPEDAEWTNFYGGARLYGIAGRDWIPTLEAVTIRNPEKKAKWLAETEVRRRKREEEERRQREYEEKIAVYQAEAMDRWDDKMQDPPTVNWQHGETYMRAQMAWAMMTQAGACSPPREYVADFPVDTPAATIWENVLNFVSSPSGKRVQAYWITTITGYVSGLLRETIRKIKAEVTPEMKARWDLHYDESTKLEDPEFRALYLKHLPWAYLEQRLRENGKYIVTEWEAGMGPATQAGPDVIVTPGNKQEVKAADDTVPF